DAAVSAKTALGPRTAYQAAAFYYDNTKHMTQAAKWIDQALEKNPDAYFMHYKKAQIQGEAWQQERSDRLGTKGDRHPEERQSTGRIRDQKRTADHRQLEVRISCHLAGSLGGVHLGSGRSLKLSAKKSSV